MEQDCGEDGECREKSLLAYNAYVKCISALDIRMVSKFMSAHCYEDIVLLVAWGNEKCLNGQMCMELRGLQVVQSYLLIVWGIYPDTVLEFDLVKIQATNPTASYRYGDYVVYAKVRFVAHQIYSINVIDLLRV
ncbi:hypothetical protein EON65_23105 [archaeon]|nr:MAG: hypothetical protein EON65_23105 [archaeon]